MKPFDAKMRASTVVQDTNDANDHRQETPDPSRGRDGQAEVSDERPGEATASAGQGAEEQSYEVSAS